MSNHNLVVSDNNRQVQRLDHAGMPVEVAEELRHDEVEIWTYLDELDRNHLKLALTLWRDHGIYAKLGNNRYTTETWLGYVAQFAPRLTLVKANQLVKIAEKLLQDEAVWSALPESIRNGPVELQYQYAMTDEINRPRIGAPIEEGGIPLSGQAIAAERLIAQKAETRSRELEVALAKAVDELAKIELTREQAEKTLDYALMESENARLKLAEQEREMKARIADATATERERLENSYKSALDRLEKDLRRTREQADKDLKTANTALTQARQLSQNLTEQLKQSRDQGAIWARWEIAAVRFGKQIEQIIAEMPPEAEMAVYLDWHWNLLRDLGKRVDVLSSLVRDRLAVGNAVEAGRNA